MRVCECVCMCVYVYFVDHGPLFITPLNQSIHPTPIPDAASGEKGVA